MKLRVESEAPVRVDSYLSANSEELSRAAAQKLIEGGLVKVNGKEASKSTKVISGDEIEYTLPEIKPSEAIPQDIPLDVVYEDDCMLVINKPKGMVVHPAAGNEDGTLVNALLSHCKGSLSGIGGVLRPGIVHRIDKDTGGLLLVAKNDFAHRDLSEQIKEHTAHRIYEAVVIGTPKNAEGTIDAPIGRHPVHRKKMAVVENGKPAVTHYKVMERLNGYSLVRFKLETGRTHQIRVHMAYMGHPILGDELYGGVRKEMPCNGQTLQAVEISFDHPETKKRMTFSVEKQDWFEKILLRIKRL